jgi:hypothetical protein
VRGNQITLEGGDLEVELAGKILNQLYEML